jgi:hypothetical protein
MAGDYDHFMQHIKTMRWVILFGFEQAEWWLTLSPFFFQQSCKDPLKHKARRIDKWNVQHPEPRLDTIPSIALLYFPTFGWCDPGRGRNGHYTQRHRTLRPRHAPGRSPRKKVVWLSVFFPIHTWSSWILVNLPPPYARWTETSPWYAYVQFPCDIQSPTRLYVSEPWANNFTFCTVRKYQSVSRQPFNRNCPAYALWSQHHPLPDNAIPLPAKTSAQ